MVKRAITFIRPLLFLVAFSVMGCGRGIFPGNPCDYDIECQRGLTCMDDGSGAGGAVCTRECAVDEDCPEPYTNCLRESCKPRDVDGALVCRYQAICV